MEAATKQCDKCNGTGQVTDWTVFGPAMREKRRAAGIGAKQMCQSLNISSSFLGDLERGKRGWTAARIEEYKIALVNGTGETS